MRIGICGFLGSGKTLFLTILANEAYKKGIKVLSNYDMPFAEKVNALDIMNFDLENCFLAIDEMGTILDSRLNSNANRLFTYFMLQSRKRGVELSYTSQIFGMVDLRLRYITDLVVLAERLSNKNFSYTFYSGAIPIKHMILPEQRAKEYYDLYDTSQIILPIDFLSGQNIDLDKIINFFKEMPTKTAFVAYLRAEVPFITIDNAKGVYDLLKYEKFEQVKKLLGI